MIKISYRDTFALFGDEFAKEYETESMKDITGLENYTSEVMEILHELHKKGKAESHPVHDESGISWVSDPNIEISMSLVENNVRHRPNGLPAVEYPNSSEWWIEGVRHRDDGPATIYGKNFGWWWKGFSMGEKTSGTFWLDYALQKLYSLTTGRVDRDRFVELINKAFPKGKAEDYV